MSAADAVRLPLDHIGLLGPDIDGMVSECTDLGFSVSAPTLLEDRSSGAEATSLGQRSAHIMFADNYVELTSVHAPTPDHHLARFLDGPWGVRLVILATRDIDTAAADALRAGLSPSDVHAASREIDGDVAGTARFRWLSLGADVLPEALVGFVEHQTRDLVFANAPEHANGAVGLHFLGIVGGSVPDAYSSLAVTAGGLPMRSVRAPRLDGAPNANAGQYTPICVIGVKCRSLDQTRAYFDRGDVDYSRTAVSLGTIACNTVFVFSDR